MPSGLTRPLGIQHLTEYLQELFAAIVDCWQANRKRHWVLVHWFTVLSSNEINLCLPCEKNSFPLLSAVIEQVKEWRKLSLRYHE